MRVRLLQAVPNFNMTLTAKEVKTLAVAVDTHECEDKSDFKDSDYRLEISQASGIGTNLYVRCIRCNIKIDITDYSVW